MEDHLKRAQELSAQEKATLEKKQKSLELQMKLKNAEAENEVNKMQQSLQQQQNFSRASGQKGRRRKGKTQQGHFVRAERGVDEKAMLHVPA